LKRRKSTGPRPKMYRMRGTLLLSMHQPAAAEDSYRQALTVAQHVAPRLQRVRVLEVRVL
jgi:hypothetical protein